MAGIAWPFVLLVWRYIKWLNGRVGLMRPLSLTTKITGLNCG